MDYVDLQRRRGDRARVRLKPEAPPRSVVRDPLFPVGTSFVLGSVFTAAYLSVCSVQAILIWTLAICE